METTVTTGVEVTLYKTETCQPCKPTIQKMDERNVDFNVLTLIFDENHEPTPDSAPHLDYIKGELGYIGSPVTVVKIEDDMKARVPAAIDELATSSYAQEVLRDLRDKGIAHWHGFVPDRIAAVAHLQQMLVPQPA